MSAPNEAIHTMTNPKGTGWVNQANGTTLSAHRIKKAAVKSGKALAKRHGTDLTVHRRDGSVLKTHSFAPSAIV